MKRNIQSSNPEISIAVIFAILAILTSSSAAATVNIDLDTTNQTIRGFGGMNFPRWIGTLTDAQVDTAFGTDSGQIGLTILRCDVPPDSGYWSDEVPAAVRAKSHGAIVVASPWSPPASMKSNGSTTGGYLLPASYGAYATHLSDFANYMSSNSASLYAVSIQNEPDWLPDYESCGWTSSQMSTFLDNNASVIPVSVIAPETVHPKSDWYSDLSSATELDIYADHLYGGSPTSFAKEHWMTEHYTDSSISGNAWPEALDAAVEVSNCMANDYSAYIWWYVRRSYGLIDESGVITKRGYCMSHFAKFVRPGYVRIDATYEPSSSVYVTAYKSGSTLVIVAINQNSSSSSVTFSLSGGSVGSYTKYETTSSNSMSNMGSVGSTDTLAAYSINTYVGTFDTCPQQTLSCSSTTGGSVIVPGEGDFQYAQDSNATIVAEADQFYHFDVWSGSGVTAGKVADPYAISTTVFMDANYAVVAEFEPNPPDTTPPNPDPLVFASFPTATGSTTITMTATTATDDSPPVEYYFECTNDSDANSGWQTSPTYVAQGLTPSTLYTFRVKARDSYTTPNETGFSGTASATTEPPGADIEIIGDWVTGTAHTKESGYNRALIFIAHCEHNAAVSLTGVTYGGQTMTKVIDIVTGTSGFRNYVAAFVLDEPNIVAASSGTFVPTWSTTPTTVTYDSVFLENVNQTNIIGATDSANVTVATVECGPLDTDDGDMVILGAVCGNNGSYTLNNGFTEGNDQSVGTNGHTGVTGYKPAVGDPETPSATHSNANRNAIIGFVVQAAAAVDEPPAAPTTLAATAGNSLVELDWNDNNELDLDGYNVYRSETSGSGYGKINVSPVADSNYVDSDVNNGTPYYYVVTAVDANANESSYSNEASATPDYQDCNDVQAGGYGLVSDLNGDCHVDLLDVEIITQYWLHSDCAGLDNCENADMEPDGDVDAADFSDFAIDWMKCNNPGESGCIENW